jgi:serine phosphatase RsbU (regulator of sigma subunit)
MAELVITLSDGRLIRHRLTLRPMVIGRDAGCELPIDDPSASRRHACFTPTPDGYIVEDLGSKNGTLVNDLPCKNTPLRHGDRVLIGGVLAVFHAEPVSTPSVVLSDDRGSSRATHYVPRDQALLLPQRRLQLIYELTERLTTLKSRDSLLEDAMSICFEMLQFERGAIAIRRQNQRTVDWPVVRNLRGVEGELTISRSLLARALEHGERAIFTESGAATDPTVSMVQHGIRSAMCVPLIEGDATIGVIYGDRTSTSTSYTNEDIDFFAAIARQVSIGLINARLLEDQKQMIKLHHDLDLARTIQNGLFPKALPNTAELRIAALNDPGRRVSGDYYDVIERDDGRVWCLIADVTGEGAAAAFQMANLQAVVRATIGESDQPGRLLARWNDFIYKNTHQSRIITCLLALVDPKARTAAFASAGHWPPLLVAATDVAPKDVALDAGYPLGVAADAEFPTSMVELGSDPCMLFCFTDGVIEAWNPEGQSFGLDQLRQALTGRSELNPQAAVKHVRKQVASFAGAAEQSDDITMLAVRVG